MEMLLRIRPVRRRHALVDFRELDLRVSADRRSNPASVAFWRQFNDMHADLFDDADTPRAVLQKELVKLR